VLAGLQPATPIPTPELATAHAIPSEAGPPLATTDEIDGGARTATIYVGRLTSSAESQSVGDGAETPSTNSEPAEAPPARLPLSPNSSRHSAPSASNGEQVERSHRGVVTMRAAAPVAMSAAGTQVRATPAGASQSSGSRPAFTPD
jgi:hypothetical protein